MVEKNRRTPRKKFVFWLILIVVILTAGGGVLWWYNHEQYVTKIKAESFTTTELSQPNNDIDALVEKKTGKSLERWQKKRLTKQSFVTAQEAIYVGQALFIKNDASQAKKAYVAAEELANGDEKTYLFYIDYASIAAAAGDATAIDGLEQKAHGAIKNNSSMQDDEKEIMNKYVSMKFKAIRGSD